MESKMKQLVLIIFVPLVLIGQTNSLPQSVQEKINQAKDYYDVSLYEDSKKLLLELLHSEEGKNNEAEIRYHLGLVSFYDGNINDARIQWKQVILKYPTHERSRQLNRIMANYISKSDENVMFREEEFEFGDDLRQVSRFWTPIPLNEKLFWGDLKDPQTAIDYYNKLIEKYDDPKKKFQLLYHTFLLHAGINADGFGYKNQGAGTGGFGIKTKSKPIPNDFLSGQNVHNILKQMEEHVTDETDPNYGNLIQAYYLWAIKTSDSKFFSGKVKVLPLSKPYFEKVIEMTESNQNNIYRTFSQHWLQQ
jgi:tetratricopeptide (TPR) repeat protein